LVKALTPLLPEADHSGIYAAMTGTRADGVNCDPNFQKKRVYKTQRLTVEIQVLTGSDEVQEEA